MFHKKEKQKETDLVVLRNIGTSYELAAIKGLLDSNEIPYIVNEKGSGQYLRISFGFSVMGADILVPEPLFEKANALLKEISWDEETDMNDFNFDEIDFDKDPEEQE